MCEAEEVRAHDDVEMLNLPGIQNPYFMDDEGATLEETSKHIVNLVTNLRCDVSLPESKLQAFLDGFSTILKISQKFAMAKVKQFLYDKQLPVDDEITKDFIESLYIPDITT